MLSFKFKDSSKTKCQGHDTLCSNDSRPQTLNEQKQFICALA